MSKKENKGQTARKRVLRNQVKRITNGIFSNLTDLILFTSFLPAASIGQSRNYKGVDRTFKEAQDFLQEVNYKKIKRALYNLKKQGFIDSVKQPLITKAGTKRLQDNIPSYDEKRPWDGNVYLISYDVSLKQNKLRDLLRNKLKKLGAIKMQESVYMVFYNPLDVLKKTLDSYDLHSMILVSQLTKEGILGKDDFKNFIWEKANLDDVNQKYLDFIEKYKNPQMYPRFEITLDLLSAVAIDPQIPFELLKEDYAGDQAYLFYLKLLSQ